MSKILREVFACIKVIFILSKNLDLLSANVIFNG